MKRFQKILTIVAVVAIFAVQYFFVSNVVACPVKPYLMPSDQTTNVGSNFEYKIPVLAGQGTCGEVEAFYKGSNWPAGMDLVGDTIKWTPQSPGIYNVAICAEFSAYNTNCCRSYGVWRECKTFQITVNPGVPIPIPIPFVMNSPCGYLSDPMSASFGDGKFDGLRAFRFYLPHDISGFKFGFTTRHTGAVQYVRYRFNIEGQSAFYTSGWLKSDVFVETTYNGTLKKGWHRIILSIQRGSYTGTDRRYGLWDLTLYELTGYPNPFI